MTFDQLPMTTKQPILPIADAKAPFFFGVDVGGTNIKIGLLDDSGRTLAFESIETREPEGPEQAILRSAETCRELATRIGADFRAIPRIGLGTPGSMCLERGMLLQPPNLPNWYEFPIVDRLELASGLPVSFINDANAAAFGEFWVGTGSEHRSLVMLTLGTGVGGGIISEGHLINGANSFGSECGHIVVDCHKDARLCVWDGGRGQLEAYASASAVVKRTEEQLRKGAQSSLNRILMNGKTITAKRVHDAAVSGDDFAMQIIDEVAFYLGVGITSIVHMVDPGLVVLGGAMNFGGNSCSIGKRFLEKVTAEFAERTFPNVKNGTKIEFASLGGDAGYIGAAGIARQTYHDAD